MISGSDKFQNVPSHQEVSGHADVDNINTFTFTDSVYAFEDVTNEPRDNTFHPFNPINNRQDFRAKIDSAFNRNLPNSFKSGSSVLPAFADLTSAKKSSVQNILPNTKSSGNRDEETFLVVSDVAEGEDRNVDEQQKVTDDFADNVNTHHEPASVLPESSDIRNSVHRAQGHLRHQDHPMTNEEEEADPKKESRIVETLDSDKIIGDDSSKSLDNKQILWRSEDISLLNDQDNLLETRTDPSKEQLRQRLPKKLHESLSNKNKEFTFVDLPNLDKIDDFATVIEKNSTEGNVRRTVIIKNTPEAIQAFGVRNAPLQRNTFREILDQGTKIAPNIQKPSNENFQRLETAILDAASNVVSRNNDNNQLNGDVVLEMESKINHGDIAGKPEILGENSGKLKEALGPKSDKNKVSIAPHIEKPSTENIEVLETFISTLDPAPNAVSNEHDERLNVIENETNNNHKDIAKKKIQANSDKSKETLMFENEENNITIEENELFQTFINNDTNGNVQRTIVIKNTPEALKMFGIENVPFLLKKNTESDSIRALNEQIDKVFDEEESFLYEENENLLVIHDNEEATDFEYRNDDLNFIVGYELDSNAFNPLEKLRLNAIEASKDSKIESEEESQTLKTLFYEDLSQENIFLNEPKKSLDEDNTLKAFEFKSPELDLTINSLDVDDIMDEIDIDLFNLKHSDERMPEVFSEIVSSDINNGAGAGLIEDSPIIGKYSDQEQMMEHLDQGEHFSKLLTQDLFDQDNSSPPALNQFETILVSTKEIFDNSEELPLISPGEFIVYSEEILDTDLLSEADLSPSPDPRLHTEHGGNNLIFPDKNSFAKNPAISEGQTVTVIGSDNFLSKSPEPELVIPSTLDHEQNNQFLSSSQISSFLSINKSPSGTNAVHINDQKTQKSEEDHQVEISSNLHSGDNNVLTRGPPDHDIVKNQNTGPTVSIDNRPDSMIFSNVNNQPQHSNFVRFPTDDATVFSNNDIFDADKQNILEENNLSNVINNQNKAISHNNNNENNNKLNRSNNNFFRNQNTHITSGINHNRHAVIPSNNNNVFNINVNSNKNINSNSNNKDTNLKTSNNNVTPVPMNFRSASGRIRIPVTFQYGFEPITDQYQSSDPTRAPPPLLSPTPGSKSSLLKKPLRIPKRMNNLKHFVRPRKTNVVEFYQQPTVLDRFSGWF